VLFLDELPEFGRSVLESIRQPLEDRVVTVSRANGNCTFPANFMMVSAMNPCPCGYHGDPTKQCSCSSSGVTRYQHQISGPLMDRIDLFVEVPGGLREADGRPSAEGSTEVRARVEECRASSAALLGVADVLERGDGAGGGARVLPAYLDDAARSLCGWR
jgi:magnesium chelatase family protein